MAKHLLNTTIVYRIITWVLFPAAIIHCLVTAIKYRHLAYFFHRLGVYPQFNHSSNPVWCHCASVGELNTALPLLKKLIDKDYTLIISTNTMTSKQVFDRANLTNASHVFLPLDYQWTANRFLKNYSPKNCLVFETELWPNILLSTLNSNVPISIINGRISNNTFDAPNFLKTNYQKILSNISHIFASSQKNASRFISLGANDNVVQIHENLKFANLSATNSVREDKPLSHRFLLCASTHEGEEKVIIKQWKKNPPKELGLVIAVRHPHRAKDVCTIINQSGYNVKLHSQQPTDVLPSDIYVIDTIGDLVPFYQHADIVFMGGSLVPIGGHNVLEPAQFSKCILTGPFFDSFSEIVQGLLHAKGIITINDPEHFIEEVIALNNNDERRASTGNNAKQFILSKTSLLENYSNAVLKILN